MISHIPIVYCVMSCYTNDPIHDFLIYTYHLTKRFVAYGYSYDSKICKLE